MKHVLVVGATGALLGVSKYFIEQGHLVTLLARSPMKLYGIKSEYPIASRRVSIIAQDYYESDAALFKVEDAVEKTRPIDIAIVRIDREGNLFAKKLFSYLLRQENKAQIYRILCSTKVKPERLTASRLLKNYPQKYREIYLGYQQEDGNSRWLTQDEVVSGVIDAVENDNQTYTIGKTEPWENRPE